jgi:hypothetical protein
VGSECSLSGSARGRDHGSRAPCPPRLSVAFPDSAPSPFPGTYLDGATTSELQLRLRQGPLRNVRLLGRSKQIFRRIWAAASLRFELVHHIPYASPVFAVLLLIPAYTSKPQPPSPLHQPLAEFLVREVDPPLGQVVFGNLTPGNALLEGLRRPVE